MGIALKARRDQLSKVLSAACVGWANDRKTNIAKNQEYRDVILFRTYGIPFNSWLPIFDPYFPDRDGCKEKIPWTVILRGEYSKWNVRK